MLLQRTTTLLCHLTNLRIRTSSNRRPITLNDRMWSPLTSQRFATAVPKAGTGAAQAVLLKVPKKEDLDEATELELPTQQEAQLQITESAAEKLRSIATSENDSSLSLRIAVESGGCHGYQYKMELTSEQAPDDYQFSHPTHKPSSIIIDAISLGLLKGSTVDYATELIGSSFRIVDNPQAKGSGCGCGVSWEAKL